MGDYSNAPADKMTRAYLKIRNKRAELKAAFTQEDDELARQLDILKRALLSYCDRNKVESSIKRRCERSGRRRKSKKSMDE